MKKWHTVALAVLCAGSFYSPMALAGEGFNPCALLSQGEVETLVGEAVQAPEFKETGNPLGQKMCLYTTVGSDRLIQISVTRTGDMSAKVRASGQSAPTIYATTKQMLSPVEPVVGIEDDAFWGVPGLHVLRGETYLLIAVGNTSKAGNRSLAQQIAEKLVPRL